MNISLELLLTTSLKKGSSMNLPMNHSARKSSRASKAVCSKRDDMEMFFEESMVIINKIGTTIMSWNIKIPKERFPYSLLMSLELLRIFRTIAVEERASAAAITIEDSMSSPKRE